MFKHISATSQGSQQWQIQRGQRGQVTPKSINNGFRRIMKHLNYWCATPQRQLLKKWHLWAMNKRSLIFFLNRQCPLNVKSWILGPSPSEIPTELPLVLLVGWLVYWTWVSHSVKSTWKQLFLCLGLHSSGGRNTNAQIIIHFQFLITCRNIYAVNSKHDAGKNRRKTTFAQTDKILGMNVRKAYKCVLFLGDGRPLFSRLGLCECPVFTSDEFIFCCGWSLKWKYPWFWQLLKVKERVKVHGFSTATVTELKRTA